MTLRSLRGHVKADGTAKVSYPDQEAALDAARRQNGDGPRRVRAYQCSLCERWHIGQRKGGGLRAGALRGHKRGER